MTLDEAVKQVREALESAPNTAYALAIRLQHSDGYQADKLMQAAKQQMDEAYQEAPPAPELPALEDLDLPDEEQIYAAMVTDIDNNTNQAGAPRKPLTPQGHAIVRAFAKEMVMQREIILRSLGIQ